jgi:hypothetical protein
MWSLLAVCLAAGPLSAAPTAATEAGKYVVTGAAYRATFRPEGTDFDLELKGADGQWHLIGVKPGAATFAYFAGGQEFGGRGVRATWNAETGGDTVRGAGRRRSAAWRGHGAELRLRRRGSADGRAADPGAG